jgi:hypothetical protein
MSERGHHFPRLGRNSDHARVHTLQSEPLPCTPHTAHREDSSRSYTVRHGASQLMASDAGPQARSAPHTAHREDSSRSYTVRHGASQLVAEGASPRARSTPPYETVGQEAPVRPASSTASGSYVLTFPNCLCPLALPFASLGCGISVGLDI